MTNGKIQPLLSSFTFIGSLTFPLSNTSCFLCAKGHGSTAALVTQSEHGCCVLCRYLARKISQTCHNELLVPSRNVKHNLTPPAHSLVTECHIVSADAIQFHEITAASAGTIPLRSVANLLSLLRVCGTQFPHWWILRTSGAIYNYWGATKCPTQNAERNLSKSKDRIAKEWLQFTELPLHTYMPNCLNYHQPALFIDNDVRTRNQHDMEVSLTTMCLDY